MQRTVPSIKPVFHGRTLKVSIAFATVGASKRRKASRCSGVSVVGMLCLSLLMLTCSIIYSQPYPCCPLPGRERVRVRGFTGIADPLTDPGATVSAQGE